MDEFLSLQFLNTAISEGVMAVNHSILVSDAGDVESIKLNSSGRIVMFAKIPAFNHKCRKKYPDYNQ